MPRVTWTHVAVIWGVWALIVLVGALSGCNAGSLTGTSGSGSGSGGTSCYLIINNTSPYPAHFIVDSVFGSPPLHQEQDIDTGKSGTFNVGLSFPYYSVISAGLTNAAGVFITFWQASLYSSQATGTVVVMNYPQANLIASFGPPPSP